MLDSADFPQLWMEKHDSLSWPSCIFHAWTTTERLRCSLPFVRLGFAATKHVDQNKDSDTEIISAI